MITITQDLPVSYPAFNDAFIKFTSNIGPNRAEIIPSNTSIFPDPFIIFPSPSGEFVFNLKEIAKASFSNPEFNHGSGVLSGWGQSFADNKVTVSVTIKTYSGSTSDTISKAYTFYKSVVQIGESLQDNYLLDHSLNGVDYRVKYWEGFPFDFQIKDLADSVGVTIKNKNSGNTSLPITSTLAGSMKVHMDIANTNWTSSNFSPLHSLRNNLEIYEAGVFKANLEVSKAEPCGGIYLRWFNTKGGYNYWLFDEFYRGDLKTKSIGSVATNSFLNAGSAPAPYVDFGKSGNRSFRLKTRVENYLIKTFEGLFESPNIEVYSSRSPFTLGSWTAIRMDGSFSYQNKRDLTEYTLSIDLPDIIPMTR